MAISGKITDEMRQGVDGDQLTADIGIDAEEIRWRKQFTRFDETDAERMDEMAGTFDDIADDLVDSFYDHLETSSDAQAILDSSSKPIEMLKRSQAQYLRSLGSGRYGQEYFDRRARIGKIHDMLDMGPKFYLGAYSVYYRGIFDAIADDVVEETVTDETPGADPAGPVETAVSEVVDRAMSALKLMLLDQQVAMDTYIQSYSERLTTETERREQLVEDVSDDVETPLSNLHDSADDIADRAAATRETTDEAVESMESVSDEVAQMSATVEEIAATAADVSDTSQRARELAESGTESADDALDVMSKIESSTTSVATDVAQLENRVDEIDEIVDVIDGIADQTNMLALNASIEAARAGEAGDGFAVVADEVKGLAEESQQQAGRIEETVEQVKADVTATVESLDETNRQIGDGVEQVETAMETLNDIVAAVDDAADGITEVSSATDDQAASTEEVASIVEKAAESVQTVADGIEDVADANAAQRDRIQTVSESVDRLTDDVDTDGTGLGVTQNP